MIIECHRRIYSSYMGSKAVIHVFIPIISFLRRINSRRCSVATQISYSHHIISSSLPSSYQTLSQDLGPYHLVSLLFNHSFLTFLPSGLSKSAMGFEETLSSPR